MTMPIANVELLGAVGRFILSPKTGREDLARAVTNEVEGELYRQLHVAARRALLAPGADLGLAIAGLRELIHVIDADAQRRVRARTEDPWRPKPPAPGRGHLQFADDGEPIPADEG